MKKYITILTTLSLLFAFSSCEKDDFESRPPQFSNLLVTNIDGGNELYVGSPVIVRAVEKKSGHLLGKVQYQWSTAPSASVVHKNSPSGYYEYLSEPIDTIYFSQEGTYELRLKATYQCVGSERMQGSYTEAFEDGNGSVTYSGAGSAISYLYADLSKKIKVVSK